MRFSSMTALAALVVTMAVGSANAQMTPTNGMNNNMSSAGMANDDQPGTMMKKPMMTRHQRMMRHRRMVMMRKKHMMHRNDMMDDKHGM